MTVYARGFGNDHQREGSPTHNMTGEDQYEHIASILSIVITGLTVLGAYSSSLEQSRSFEKVELKVKLAEREEQPQKTTKM